MSSLKINPDLILKDVYDQGSNANGNWKRYNDGTMECWGRRTFSGISCNSQVGNLYYSSQLNLGAFPIPFVGQVPECFIEAIGVLGKAEYTAPSIASVGYVFLFNATARTNITVTVSYKAIGKWK